MFVSACKGGKARETEGERLKMRKGSRKTEKQAVKYGKERGAI